MGEDFTVGVIVVDHQHTQPLEVFVALDRRARVGILLGQGQLEPERRAATGCAAQADLPAHHLDQALGDRQPQAATTETSGGRAVGLAEGAEQARLRLRVDADAAILYFDAEAPLPGRLVEPRDGDEHLTVAGKLDRVTHQIGHDLAYPYRIADHRNRQVVRHAADDLHALAVGQLGEQVGDVLHQLAQVEVDPLELQLAGFDLGEIEDVVDDAQQMLAGLVDGICEAPLLRTERCAAQQFGHPENAVHRRANFVTHVGQKVTLRPVAGFGAISRQAKFGGACRDLLFQFVAVRRQAPVPMLDLLEHDVESLRQFADLVARFDRCAQRVIAIS